MCEWRDHNVLIMLSHWAEETVWHDDYDNLSWKEMNWSHKCVQRV